MIDTVFGIKVRMSGLSINRYRPIISRLLDARPLPYRCISTVYPCVTKNIDCDITLVSIYTVVKVGDF